MDLQSLLIIFLKHLIDLVSKAFFERPVMLVIHLSQSNRTDRGKMYGFVRFWIEKDAMNNIRVLNTTMVRGARIRVCLVKYGKGSLDSNVKQAFKQSWRMKVKQKESKVWVQKISQVNKVKSTHMKQVKPTTLKGGLNADFMEWLNRSVVGESEEPRDLEVLSKALVKDDCSKIYALSKFKFILTFPTVEKMEEALENRAFLNKWFQEEKRWDVIRFVAQGEHGLKFSKFPDMAGRCKTLKS